MCRVLNQLSPLATKHVVVAIVFSETGKIKPLIFSFEPLKVKENYCDNSSRILIIFIRKYITPLFENSTDSQDPH